MDGYGNDATASSDPSGGAGSSDGTASAIAQIFSTGVTAYVDSQAIQRGYQINNPRYFQSGYPAGQGVTYSPTSAGAPIGQGSSSNTLLLVGIAAVVLFLVLRK